MFAGLDPALPLFNRTSNEHIKKTDADFVDIIHTNANNHGILDAVGDVDFYVNGGATQPGCGADRMWMIINYFYQIPNYFLGEREVEGGGHSM